MAERHYTIRLINDTGDSGGQQSTATTPNSDGKTEKPRLDSKIKGAAVVGTAYSTLKSIVDPIASSHINTVALRTGYEEQQQRQQMAYSIGKQLADTTMSIGIGAAFGGVGGALVGATLSLGRELYSYMIRKNEIRISQNIENNQISLNQIRIGASGNRGGTR